MKVVGGWPWNDGRPDRGPEGGPWGGCAATAATKVAMGARENFIVA